MSKHSVIIRKEHKELLDYLVLYRKLRQRTDRGDTVEQLIVAHAKAVLSSMPEPKWRKNLLELINRAEADDVKE